MPIPWVKVIRLLLGKEEENRILPPLVVASRVVMAAPNAPELSLPIVFVTVTDKVWAKRRDGKNKTENKKEKTGIFKCLSK